MYKNWPIFGVVMTRNRRFNFFYFTAGMDVNSQSVHVSCFVTRLAALCSAEFWDLWSLLPCSCSYGGNCAAVQRSAEETRWVSDWDNFEVISWCSCGDRVCWRSNVSSWQHAAAATASTRDVSTDLQTRAAWSTSSNGFNDE